MKPAPGEDAPGCAPPDPQRESDDLGLQIGWVPGARDRQQCSTGKHGIEACIICTSKDGCHQTVTKPPVDPGIANNDPEAAGSSNCSGYPAKCEEIVFEEQDIIIADPPATNESETKTKPTDPPALSPSKHRENPGSGPSLNRPKATEYTVNFGEETIVGEIWAKKPTEHTVNFDEETIIGARKPRSGAGKKGDPVLLADGGLVIETTDLSFAGPVRALEFRRSYTSTSEDRSVLGSNWQHNWDVRVERLRQETTPTWAAPFCLGADPTPSCVVLHTGNGSRRLFFYDAESRLYLPQAGNTDTLGVTAEGGFSLRTADGGILTFNVTGQLVEVRDRFGNGFSIEVENTPIYDLYLWLCELPRFAPPIRPARRPVHGIGIGGGADAAYIARRCSVLSWLVGDRAKPVSTDPAWAVSLADYRPMPSIAFGLGRAEDGRAHLLALLAAGFDARHAYGARKQRVKKVTDDLGRSLAFTYWTPQDHDYAGLPQADLLRYVSGPAGTKVSFEYSRPANYPAKLGEMFLTKVQRHDEPALEGVVATADRTFEYHYQWPGGAALSYDTGQNRDRVRDAFRAYYEKFVGCLAAYEICSGHSGKDILIPGNPADMADTEADAYVSRVADNLTEWVADGVVRTESRFQIDPFSSAEDFDRITAQRYGSSRSTQVAAAPDAPTDKWRTSLPKAVFAYASAGPSAVPASDRTDDFLPEQIRDRYPLESWTPTQELPADPPVVAAAGTASSAPICDFGGVEAARLALPEQFPTVPYYTPEPTERHPNFNAPIRRTRVTCEQIAEAQLSDALHNEVVSALEPITSTQNPFDWKISRTIGGRQRISADSNRICAWTSVHDRDGNLGYQGLNYRGQVLVDALKRKSGLGWRYKEHLYNADGMLVQDRRPLTSETPWSAEAGYTAYFYEEIDPSGNNGANNWLPAFWSRRQNLLRWEEHPSTGKVLNAIEATSGAAPAAISLVEGLGRYRRFTYEPLFNQLKAMESGSIETRTAEGSMGPTLVPHERIDIVYDYQELDPLGLPEKSAVPLLRALEPWGFPWRRKGADGKNYDFDVISTWQLPLPFFGVDLNGDGRIGFSAGAPWARGVPILITHRPAGSPPDAGEKLAISWAPHGQPALIVASNGAMQRVDYYPVQGTPDAVYGPATLPGPDAAGTGRRGFLARVSTLRFDNAYDPVAAPSGASCTKLAGPYQWLLPAGCSNIDSELRALGLAPQAIHAIIAASTPGSSERWLTEAFAYTELGAPRRRWDANEGTWTFLRDTDARPREIERPIGAKLVMDLTPDGFVRRETQFDDQGNLLADLRRHFDEDGHILHECQAKTAGGCDPPGPNAKTAVETSFEYTPEGLLRLETGPDGLRTETFYDERGLPSRRKIDHATRPVQARWELWLYDLDGNVIYSSLRETVVPIPSRIVVGEAFSYDGLQRLITHRDIRGYTWQFAHSRRDLLVRTKRDDAPYAVGGPPSGSPSREDEYRYDDFGRFRESYQNGLLTARFNLAAFGFLRSSTSLGRGVTQVTHDLTGRPLWARDATGSQRVLTESLSARQNTDSKSRKAATGRRLTTTAVVELDANGLIVTSTLFGDGRERRGKTVRNGLGQIEGTHEADGSITTYERNLVGWTLFLHRWRAQGGAGPVDTTEFLYNNLGAVTRVVDAAQQVSEFDYDPFGAFEEHRLPGNPAITITFRYDAVGRPLRAIRQGGTILTEYDRRGDPIRDWLETGAEPQLIAEREYDDLGFLRTARNYNPALSWLQATDRVVTRILHYDKLGRLAHEVVQVGSTPPRGVDSVWDIVPPDVWRRRVSLRWPRGVSQVSEFFDLAGRFVRHEWHRPSAGSIATNFDWLGDIYVGRRQVQSSGGSPFRQTVRLDPFGAPLAWEYRAIDLDQHSNPADPTEGTAYCGGAWRTECGRALLAVDVLRYETDKIASLNWSFGYPLVQGGRFVQFTHPTPWQGYSYTRFGELDRTWEHDGVTSVVRPQGLQTHSVTPTDISVLGSASVAWQYDRLPTGDTKAIRRVASGTQRWAQTTPRGPGHQLSRIQVDQIPHTLKHDSQGNVVVDNARSFAFDPQGQLAAVLTNGAVVEAYAYDDSGRLSALFKGTGATPSEVIIHDGESMVAGFPSSGAPNWQAAWGPGPDRLIELRSSTGDHIPLVDHRNSIVATWVPGPNGGVSGMAEYNPEGRLLRRERDGSVACREVGVTVCRPPGEIPFGFVTAWRSFTSGLLYLRQRWYSPELGEFISHDPAGYSGDGNTYAYAAFDPINNWDPTGLDPRSFAPTRAEVEPERTRSDPDKSRTTNVFDKQTPPSTGSNSGKIWPRAPLTTTTGFRQDGESREGRWRSPHWMRRGGPAAGPPQRAFPIPWQTSRRPRTSVPGPSATPPPNLLPNIYYRGQHSRITTRANAQNYAYLFRRSRPDMPKHWHVHHSLPQQYANLFNLNIHEPFFLRGVDPVVHEHIHRAWDTFYARHGGNPTVQQIVRFAQDIDARYSNTMIFSDALPPHPALPPPP